MILLASCPFCTPCRPLRRRRLSAPAHARRCRSAVRQRTKTEAEALANSAAAATRAQEEQERAEADLAAAIAASAVSTAEGQARRDAKEQANISAAVAASPDDIDTYAGDVPVAAGKAATSAAYKAAPPIVVSQPGRRWLRVRQVLRGPAPPGQLAADIAAILQEVQEYPAAMGSLETDARARLENDITGCAAWFNFHYGGVAELAYDERDMSFEAWRSA
eukprot:6182506-Pleurochrysis_carterae.AAC.5